MNSGREILSNKATGLTDDPMAEARKKDHIDLAFRSQTLREADNRLYYEPMLSAHPKEDLKEINFLGKSMKAPIWISSMTGGTELAGKINQNLARACNEFGIGMGLGSCRALLDSDAHLQDFNLRPIIGDALPFYANLGIAQVEQLVESNGLSNITQLVDKLDADGLIIHVNPFQEWLQPEGDRIKRAPIETIHQALSETELKVIVKEVGQGIGLESLRALMKLPLEAIEFAAYGGTNFAKVELMREAGTQQELYEPLAYIGHTAEEMVEWANTIIEEEGDSIEVKELIISGGIKSFLDGYYLINKVNCRAVYGQGSAFLKHAKESYEDLQTFVANQIEGLKLANAYLRIR